MFKLQEMCINLKNKTNFLSLFFAVKQSLTCKILILAPHENWNREVKILIFLYCLVEICVVFFYNEMLF